MIAISGKKSFEQKKIFGLYEHNVSTRIAGSSMRPHLEVYSYIYVMRVRIHHQNLMISILEKNTKKPCSHSDCKVFRYLDISHNLYFVHIFDYLVYYYPIKSNRDTLWSIFAAFLTIFDLMINFAKRGEICARGWKKIEYQILCGELTEDTIFSIEQSLDILDQIMMSALTSVLH